MFFAPESADEVWCVLVWRTVQRTTPRRTALYTRAQHLIRRFGRRCRIVAAAPKDFRHQPGVADHPASTGRVTPVTAEAAGEARNATTAATSSGRTVRPRALAAAHRRTPSGHCSARPGRSTRPGATALTRIPCAPTSPAAAAARWCRAALATAYGAWS